MLLPIQAQWVFGRIMGQIGSPARRLPPREKPSGTGVGGAFVRPGSAGNGLQGALRAARWLFGPIDRILKVRRAGPISDRVRDIFIQSPLTGLNRI